VKTVRQEVQVVKKESKILIGVMAMLLVALPLIGGVMATDDYTQESDESNLVADDSEQKIRRFSVLCKLRQEKQRRVIWFFKGAEKDTITGTITARDRNVIIVTNGEDRFNVVVARRWNVDSEVVSLQQMFDEGYIPNETVTLTVLKRAVTNENDVTVTIIFGYEITTSSNHLYAVLPFNIEG